MKISIGGGRASVILDRPDRMNALSTSMFEGIDSALDEAVAAGARVLTISGAGRAFCAGADVSELGNTAATARPWLELGHQVFSRLADLGIPTVAAINGHALGGGLELALCCDLLIASETAKLGLPEPTLGLIPGLGGTQRLPAAIGPHRASRMLLTGAVITAAEAHEVGLLSVPPVALGELEKCVDALAARVLSLSPTALAAIKRAVSAGPQEAGLRREVELAAEAVGTEDGLEGVAAFLEKRAPTFSIGADA
ncbi:MAG: enoyl-CoA hydratase-related protein [Actinomycetota bacterium]|nr:enoyl-CoA hydratase-related protein [Actinomycetota bacterium]